ncbi:MAG: prolipoprotein diacylglyceryl transferase [Thermoleophilia bacterium]|nr:prolipoprotein diacylglyceryl transferase [Thermoleophilia bacterium]
MYPQLFSVGPFTVHSYGLMMMLGFLAAGITAYYGFKRRGLDTQNLFILVFAAAVGGLAGAKIDYLLVNAGEFKNDPVGTVLSGAGLIWFGGFLGALVLSLAVMSIYRLPWAKVLDAAAPAVAIGYAFGRIGCFLNGTCYGRESDLPWAVAFPNGAMPTDIAVQPTQLYSSLAAFAIFGALLVLQPRLKRDWSLFLVFLIMAGAERFLVEFLRFNRDGQLQARVVAVSIAAAAGLTLIWVLRRPAVKEAPSRAYP